MKNRTHLTFISTCGFLFFFLISRMLIGLETAPVKVICQKDTYVAESHIESDKTALIAPQITGEVVVLNVKAGDYVKKGEVLFKIDERTAHQDVLASQAQLQAAEAQLALAEITFKRAEYLYKKTFLSHAAYDTALTQYKISKKQAEGQIASTKSALVNAGNFTVKAPFSGYISDVQIELGDMVALQTPALTLYTPDQMRASAEVPQSIFIDLDLKTPPLIEVEDIKNGKKQLKGQKIKVIPLSNQSSQTVLVWAYLMENGPHLMPGTFARVHFMKKDGDVQKMIIPQKSVLHRDEFDGVYVVDQQGNPHFRQLHLGEQQDDMVEVLSGLMEGEKIALDPFAAASVSR